MITASIVIYKTSFDLINNVMISIKKNEGINKIFVIDNAPSDENIQYFTKYNNVEYIEHENTGYGSSHNIALRKAIELGSEYHIVLNPDIEFDFNVISNLEEYMSNHNDVVYMLPKVIYPNGDIQYLCKLLPSPVNLLFRRFLPTNKFTKKMDEKYSLIYSGYNKVMNPPCLSGCFMFLRVDTIRDNNLFFDERYFMYLEDFDLMRRLHRVGKTVFYPEVSIIHNHAKESYKSKKMLKIHIQSAIKYFNKFGWFFDKERKEMNKKILKEIEELNKKEN